MYIQLHTCTAVACTVIEKDRFLGLQYSGTFLSRLKKIQDET